MITASAEFKTESVDAPGLPSGPPSLRIARLALPGIFLAIVCLFPFLNKAYTNDDPWFLLEARQILKTPLQPMSFPVCWLVTTPCVSKASSLGPGAAQALIGYLLVPVTLAGSHEWMAHLLQLLLACIAVLAMVRFALRLGYSRTQAAVAGLMLVAITPFLPMASTAMPDIAAVSLGLTGMERLLAWRDDRRWHQAVLASFCLGLAPYARVHVALFMPLGALWLFDDLAIGKALAQFRREAYLWAPIFVAAAILVSINFVTHDHDPQGGPASVLVGPGLAPRNLFSYFLYLSFPIPFAAVWMVTRWRETPMLLLLPAVPVLVAHFVLAPSSNPLLDWPTLGAPYGLATLGHMLYRSVRVGDRTGMLLGLWVLIPLPAVFYVHLPIKYMVAVLPAIILILIRNLSALPRRRELWAYGAVILACTGYSCVLLRADADFAEYGRRAAAELIAPHVAAGERVWYFGVMGFYWYAQEAGAVVVKPDDPGPQPGDLLAVGLLEGGKVALNRFPNRELVDSRHYDSPHGRTMGYGGALYSNGFGNALWVWNPETTNDYELWRIR